MNLINRAKNMLLTPKTEWQVVSLEQPVNNEIIMGYLVPFVLLGALAAFIGYGLVGFSFLGFNTAWGIYNAILRIILGIGSVFVTAFVLDALAPSFGSQKDFGRSLQLVVYASTPSLVAGLFAFLPLLSILVALAGAVYTIYLWYLGLGPIKNTPEDKKVVYLLVTYAVLLVAYFILSAIVGLILLPIFGLGAMAGGFHL
ncbi:MAG: Yip1 family protein [Chitinophagaceae bacterium]